MEIGQVRFSLWRGPAFVVERRSGPGLIIHEDPAIGIEPMAYVETRRGAAELLVAACAASSSISSIRLEDASINLAKPESGRWNFVSFVDRSLMSTRSGHSRPQRPRQLQIRRHQVDRLSDRYRSRYLAAGFARGRVEGLLRRASRPHRSLGPRPRRLCHCKGRWFVAPERVDLDLTLDRTGLGELTALVRGQSGDVHGTVCSRLHLGGPIDNIGIQGRLTVEDVHRWDLLPPAGQGWPLDIRGRLNLLTSNWNCNPLRRQERCRFPCASAPAITCRSRIGPLRSTGTAFRSNP